ncbi:cytochrome c oxidase subunit II [Halococcus sp. IIIV-5B]|uniref:cytochrome c oxidase subunit II n=1 Tax=Halococcus sp. IIIV-5B TaxID=2321230 RepID=UPI000E769822|nr:cytochrome c oxidase subunit II [Halococcus sp. IIIV-5B]RJT05291.1 cytochrome c oxidase subunit II [Halococcus sp. IIIV-5B]
MNRRQATAGVALAAFLTIAVEPVAAQSINKTLIESLNRQLLYVAVPLAILVEVILFYAVWKHKDNDDPSPTKENRSLEITWTIATAIILLFVGFASYNILTDPYISPSLTEQEQALGGDQNLEGAVMPANDDDAVIVRTIAYQWGWDFVYPEENVTTDNTTVVPANTDVYYHLTSRDVLHAFHAPELGLKMDTIPGQYNTIRTNITEPGTYRVYCSEFCGAGHSRMYANLTVVSQDRYQAWLSNQNRTDVPTRVSAENATNVTGSVAAPPA